MREKRERKWERKEKERRNEGVTMKKSTSLFQVERKLITNFFFFYKLFH